MFQRLRGLAVRDRQPELMDDPELDESLHADALRGLKRVNRLSRTCPVIWDAIVARFPGGAHSDRPLRILDVACGGGDIAIDLAKLARKSGRPVEVVGVDISEVAIRYATDNAAAEKVDVRFEIRDILNQPLPEGFDVVCCSLFLHHLDDDQIVQLLKAMRESGAGLIVASDLIRSRWGYLMCRIGTQLLTRCRIVHVDGPLSVRAALTIEEAAELARKAGLDSMSLTTHWPERFLLTWQAPGEDA